MVYFGNCLWKLHTRSPAVVSRFAIITRWQHHYYTIQVDVLPAVLEPNRNNIFGDIRVMVIVRVNFIRVVFNVTVTVNYVRLSFRRSGTFSHLV